MRFFDWILGMVMRVAWLIFDIGGLLGFLFVVICLLFTVFHLDIERGFGHSVCLGYCGGW